MKRKIMKFPLWVVALVILALSISTISWTTINSETQVTSIDTLDSSADNSAENNFNQYIQEVFSAAGLDKASMDQNIFRKAIVGYYNLKHSGFVSEDKSIITIVDFNKPSSEKRLWIVDLVNKKLLFHTLVAHGKGTGDNMAKSFSNISNSNQSSLGFYIADETYFGKHGLSLRLNGMDKEFNTNARNRGVVVHGADYVSQQFVNQHGRLGRSQGCPALPAELSSSIINTIKGKTVLYIDGASADYKSSYLDQQIALQNFSSQTNTMQASL